MNLKGMNLLSCVECLVQQQVEKITGPSIPDRGMNQTERDRQRGVEHLGTCDGETQEDSRSSTVEGVAGHELAKIAPSKWQRPGPSRDTEMKQL